MLWPCLIKHDQWVSPLARELQQAPDAEEVIPRLPPWSRGLGTGVRASGARALLMILLPI